MRVYSVNYDLNRPGQNYAGLISELENSPNWWHFLKSSWLIATFETPEQLWDRISPHIDKSDTVLIIEVVNRSGCPRKLGIGSTSTSEGQLETF